MLAVRASPLETKSLRDFLICDPTGAWSRTGRPRAEVVVTDEERAALVRLTKRARVNRGVASRAGIALTRIDDSDTAVARRLRTTKTTVAKWRSQFVERQLGDVLSRFPVWVNGMVWAIDPTWKHILDEKIGPNLLAIPDPLKIALVTRGKLDVGLKRMADDGWMLLGLRLGNAAPETSDTLRPDQP